MKKKSDYEIYAELKSENEIVAECLMKPYEQANTVSKLKEKSKFMESALRVLGRNAFKKQIKSLSESKKKEELLKKTRVSRKDLSESFRFRKGKLVKESDDMDRDYVEQDEMDLDESISIRDIPDEIANLEVVVSRTYSKFSNMDDDGEYDEDTGFDYEDQKMTVEDLLIEIDEEQGPQGAEFSDTMPGEGTWISGSLVDDLESGEKKTYSWHFDSWGVNEYVVAILLDRLGIASASRFEDSPEYKEAIEIVSAQLGEACVKKKVKNEAIDTDQIPEEYQDLSMPTSNIWFNMPISKLAKYVDIEDFNIKEHLTINEIKPFIPKQDQKRMEGILRIISKYDDFLPAYDEDDNAEVEEYEDQGAFNIAPLSPVSVLSLVLADVLSPTYGAAVQYFNDSSSALAEALKSLENDQEMTKIIRTSLESAIPEGKLNSLYNLGFVFALSQLQDGEYESLLELLSSKDKIMIKDLMSLDFMAKFFDVDDIKPERIVSAQLRESRIKKKKFINEAIDTDQIPEEYQDLRMPTSNIWFNIPISELTRYVSIDDFDIDKPLTISKMKTYIPEQDRYKIDDILRILSKHKTVWADYNKEDTTSIEEYYWDYNSINIASLSPVSVLMLVFSEILSQEDEGVVEYFEQSFSVLQEAIKALEGDKIMEKFVRSSLDEAMSQYREDAGLNDIVDLGFPVALKRLVYSEFDALLKLLNSRNEVTIEDIMSLNFMTKYFDADTIQPENIADSFVKKKSK